MRVAVNEKVHHLDAHMAPQADPHHSTLTRGCLRRYFSQMVVQNLRRNQWQLMKKQMMLNHEPTEARNFV